MDKDKRPNAAMLLLLLSSSALSGCLSGVADHCSGCAVIREAQRAPRESPPAGRALVVLVHGAFGFGSEWDPVVAALKQAPELSLVVFEWRGPFHDLTGTVRDLSTVVQRALDHSPNLTQVLILAHSAGGPLATRAALALRVPAGRHVMVAEIDSPTFINGRPFFKDRIGAVPQMPPSVERVVYLAKSAPADADPLRVYLGSSVSHDQAVALAGLPLIAKLSARLDGTKDGLVCCPVNCVDLAAAGSARAQGALADEYCLYLRAVQRSERVEAAVESPQN